MCLRWQKRDKAMRIIMVFCVAFAAIPLVFVGRKVYIIGLSGNSKMDVSAILGFIVGVLFGGALCSTMWGLVLAIGGHPQKRVRELMLKFHDELKRRGDGGES